MIRTTPLPEIVVEAQPRFLAHRPVGALTGIICINCGNEVRGRKPEPDIDITCSHCVLRMCENPKAKEIAEFRFKEAEKLVKINRKKTGTHYHGERVVDRFRRLKAQKENHKMERTT